MRGITITLIGLGVVAALGAGWALHGDVLPPAWRAAVQQAPSLNPVGSAAPAPRKCVSAQGQLLYTTDACPAGTREQALAGGTVTVLAAPPAAPASAASATPLLRRLDDPAETERMRERRMQQAVGP